jgi:hypothetical protein
VKDQDGNWPRQLLFGLGALLVSALVIGGTISVVALTAADIAVRSEGSASGGPSLYIPPSSPSRTPDLPEEPQPTETEAAGPVGKGGPVAKKPPRRLITLAANPRSGSTRERIYLTGTYRGGEGSTLQVQRFEGRWVDFPVSVTVRGSRFATYVVTGQSGTKRFRVLDPSTGRTSSPVSVTLR